LVGVGLGVALSKLSGDDEPSAPAAPPSTATTRSTTTARPPAGTTTTPSTTSTPRPAARAGDDAIEVTVGSAVLHLASTPSGQRRNRARLGVRVTVRNRSTETAIPLERPSLLAANQRVETNPAADAKGSRLGPIGPGQTQRVTLQFETAGAVTEQLATQRTARVLVGGRSSAITVTPGPAVSGGAQFGATAP
jgi:hypothetical protein